MAGHDDRAEVVLEDGRVLAASAAVAATGVTALAAEDVAWAEAGEARWPAPLWRAAADDLAGRRVAVLGADRPLDTWLRAHPQAKVHFDVLFPEADQYKTDEIADDPRIRLDLIDRVTVAPVRGASGSPPGARAAARTPSSPTPCWATWARNRPPCPGWSSERTATARRTGSTRGSSSLVT
ncbi:hypothetical protein [Streptomyces nondiastaticus]|uniref:Uncharacterized protein n=1 Tax=Streptomyces nondiastaticus TaxID=3154512 RepID=A0ABW6U5W2_9ACTN